MLKLHVIRSRGAANRVRPCVRRALALTLPASFLCSTVYGSTAPRRNEQLTSQCLALTPSLYDYTGGMPVAPANLSGGRVHSQR